MKRPSNHKAQRSTKSNLAAGNREKERKVQSALRIAAQLAAARISIRLLFGCLARWLTSFQSFAACVNAKIPRAKKLRPKQAVLAWGAGGVQHVAMLQLKEANVAFVSSEWRTGAVAAPQPTASGIISPHGRS